MYNQTLINMDKKEFNRQVKLFKERYEEPMFSPMLKWNPKFLTAELENEIPYISISDLCSDNYCICSIPKEEAEFLSPGFCMMQMSRHNIIVEYSTLEELVEDGWKMGL